MKRFLPVALTVFVLLFAGLLIGPSFIDWNKYKPQIIEQAKSAAGYDVTIDGDINLALLPLPHMKIEGLVVKAPRGKAENLLSMKEADVSVNVLPLLSGNVFIDTVRLINPEISLEILPDGSNSWMSDKLLANQMAVDETVDQNATSSKKSSQNIVLNKLVIEKGRVSYSDRQSGKEQLVEDINADLKADTLQGPYAVLGSFIYNGKTVEIDASTKKGAGSKKEMPAKIEIALPELNANADFNGIVSLEPAEIQGKVEVSANSLAALLSVSGSQGKTVPGGKLEFSGFVTANENQLRSEDVSLALGETKGTGKLSIINLKDRNPVKLDADMAFQGTIDLDPLLTKNDKPEEPSVEEKVAKGQKLSARPGLIPESLSLPFPIDTNIRIAADGVKFGGKTFKGVTAALEKTGPKTAIQAKAMELPGKASAEGAVEIAFATTSKSGEQGVTYADPSATFSVRGETQQLPTLLRAFAAKDQNNPAFEIYRTGEFNLDGEVTPEAVLLRNGTVKLDQTNLRLAGSYRPYGAQGHPDVGIELVTDTVDIDHIRTRLAGQKKQAVQVKDAPAGEAVKETLKPLQSFNMPVNLSFDISAQRAIYDQQEVTGIRLIGKAAGQEVSLSNASVQNYRGASASLKGQVGNLADLSGLDLSFYGKTGDVKALMQTFDMDTSKLPAGISNAEANITAKGTANESAFDASIVALGGEVEASGKMTGLLDKPSFSDLTLGAKHPSLARAIQIFNPEFATNPGLDKPFSVNARAVENGKVYELTGVKASLADTTLAGDIKVDMSGAKPSVTGGIKAGTIPLDSFLGAKNAQKSGSGGGAVASQTGGGKWSRDTVETPWMQGMNLDLDLSAAAISYGGWRFTEPSTKIVLKDGVLQINDMKAGLFGGTASLAAKIQDPADAKQPLSMAVQSRMQDVSLEPLVTALSGTNRLKASGKVSLDMDVQTAGLSAYGLMSGLGGKANLDGANIVMNGFDLAQIGLAFVDTGKPMDRLGGILTGATSGGETRFDTVKGNYNIAQGIASITSMEMDGPAAKIVSKGAVNLPQWTIDTTHTITFKQAKEAGAFDVAIKGPLSNPGNTFGRGLFNDVLTRRLQQKAAEKLPEILGDDLGGKLQNLGILPKAQPKPAPVTPQETPTDAPPSTDASGAVVPTTTELPVEAPSQPQKTPEQQMQDDAGKALQGVINGLLR
jgi:uncharacterized protein involved in outer membrane biogenesis